MAVSIDNDDKEAKKLSNVPSRSSLSMPSPRSLVSLNSRASARELAVPLHPNERSEPALEAEAGLRRGPTETFDYEPPEVRPYPAALQVVRKHLFQGFLFVVFFGTIMMLIISWITSTPRNSSLLGIPCSRSWITFFKYLSIPLVSILFTWWHVWLGIQMVFYPVEFKGCCKPVLGWQGIVPRRAHIMASRCCDIMIGSLITIEEIIDRIQAEDFFASLHMTLVDTNEVVMTRLAQRHCPDLWERLPELVKAELKRKTLEECHAMFSPVIKDLKANVNNIVDIKQMAIDVLVDNKALLVKLFRDIGSREFIFIQHMAAVMGFVLGVVQMMLWVLLNTGGDADCNDPSGRNSFRCWGGFVVLPVSGLIIGYFTNWLGITMIFHPVDPHIVCGGYINIQGVFLKRQQQVSYEMSGMICAHLITARKMLEYVVQRPETVNAILEIFQQRMNDSIDGAIDKTLGPAKVVAPIFCGRGAIEGIKEEALKELLAELPNHSAEIEQYMDRAFALRDTLAYRLSRLSPSRFEGMLHPVFQEDEWMVLLLGGVLGLVVGALQAVALGS